MAQAHPVDLGRVCAAGLKPHLVSANDPQFEEKVTRPRHCATARPLLDFELFGARRLTRERWFRALSQCGADATIQLYSKTRHSKTKINFRYPSVQTLRGCLPRGLLAAPQPIGAVSPQRRD
jgi:hypothetical protein